MLSLSAGGSLSFHQQTLYAAFIVYDFEDVGTTCKEGRYADVLPSFLQVGHAEYFSKEGNQQINYGSAAVKNLWPRQISFFNRYVRMHAIFMQTPLKIMSS
jgi:hypothetical protein